ncbi:MAG TPA: type II toxin-antitoxin system PrlF family antitoxin [Steroidobacteraceae bacterium]
MGWGALERVGADEAADPVIESFLGFIAADIQQHPDRVRAIDANLLSRIDKLVGHIDVDLDAPLTDDEE